MEKFKWVACRVAGALIAVNGKGGNYTPLAYASRIPTDTLVGVRNALCCADTAAFRIVVENVSVFHFTVDALCLEQLSFTVSAVFSKVVRRVRSALLNVFRIMHHFNLRHLYRRERRLRL